MSGLKRLLSPAFLTSVAILAGAAVGLTAAVDSLGYYLQKLPIEVSRRVQAVPNETPSWKGVSDARFSAEMVTELGTENYLSRTYVEKNPPEGEQPRAVELHLAYYTGMIDTVPHVPERCMVGAGWTITGGGARALPIPFDETDWREDPYAPAGAGEVLTAPTPPAPYSDMPGSRQRLPRDVRDAKLRITQFADPKSGAKLFGGYFFIANGAMVSSAEEVRLKSFDLTSDYAYYLKAQVTSMDVGSAEELAEVAASLLGELLPEISRCLPDWIEVEAGRYPPDRAEAR